MKNRTYLFLLLFLLFTGCISGGNNTETPIIDKVWELRSLEGEPALADKIVTIEFKEDGNIGGTAGCNHYFSSYEINGNSLSFGVVGSTEMYCMDEDVMDQEYKFLKALGNVTGYKIDGTSLRFIDVNGHSIMQFKSRFVTIEGKIDNMTYEKDGSIINLKNERGSFDVLVSIPNLGQEYAKEVNKLEIGKNIRVSGELITIGEKDRIIASEIYIQ
jgi:heat shock protein HslJ